MTTAGFCKELEEILELTEPLTLETNLKDLEEFDSMAIMSLVAYIHKTFSKQFNARQLNNVTTVESLVDLIGSDAFDE